MAYRFLGGYFLPKPFKFLVPRGGRTPHEVALGGLESDVHGLVGKGQPSRVAPLDEEVRFSKFPKQIACKESQGMPPKSITFVSLWRVVASIVFCWACLKPASLLSFDGESAGARTQDQRLKRAMLYQLSYALRPLFQVSTFGPLNFLFNQ
jgi:hypothetical protein